nr:hypothetical protein Ade03nite_73920 [Actinoplanes derwentensis]
MKPQGRVKPPDKVEPPDQVKPPAEVKPPDQVEPPDEVKPPHKDEPSGWDKLPDEGNPAGRLRRTAPVWKRGGTRRRVEGCPWKETRWPGVAGRASTTDW